MIEPEIAFADLADNADARRGVSQAHLPRRCSTSAPDDMEFFAERIDKGVHRASCEGIVDSEFERIDYTEAIEILENVEAEVRVPGEVGHRPAVRARALPDREARRQAGGR